VYASNYKQLTWLKAASKHQGLWMKHVTRLEEDRPPRLAFQYRPSGRSNMGRSKQRWKDKENLQDQEKL